MLERISQADRFVMENVLWVIDCPTGVTLYDFSFRQFMPCKTPYAHKPELPTVLRIGPVAHYPELYALLSSQELRLIHTPEEHDRCSLLPLWYPYLKEHTPRSRWYTDVPSLSQIEDDFEFPIFIKGARQTSRHSAALSIVRSREDYRLLAECYATDPILHWQAFVCREYVSLWKVGGGMPGTIPASFEFRTFWWRGQCVASGPYWTSVDHYNWSPAQKEAGIAKARLAVEALHCTFVAVDVAMTQEGEWIIIECNDAMESGYAGSSPFLLWQAVLDIERRRMTDTDA